MYNHYYSNFRKTHNLLLVLRRRT